MSYYRIQAIEIRARKARDQETQTGINNLLNELKSENKRLRKQCEALASDLNEYREILCNKQKELDAAVKESKTLKAQIEQFRSYIAHTAGASN